MRPCPSCQQSISDDVRFCPECGAPAGADAGPTEMFEDEGRSSHPSASAPSHHGRFEPGHRLGERYRIVGLLGQGGMGDVYRADDLELGQSVALKFLPDRLASDEVELDRFRREVRVARGVAHPNVCRTYDIASSDGHVFLVMEYVDGEDLASVLRRMGRPSIDKSLEIARQLCLGLGAAHEAGVLHRDLKPANIMIDGRGRVRITDFGLAGLAEELADDRTIAGTPAYMAPEQLKEGRVTTASEVYSLGLILHEVFTGQRVFDTHNVQELQQLHSESRITTPSSIVEGIDPVVERVLMRCLDADPVRRPQSAYGVLAALPGGDPLAAALAAGETPSPELVADAGVQGVVSPRIAIPAVLVTVILFLTIAGLQGRSLEVLDKSASELSVLADQSYERLVGGDLPRYEDGGFFRPSLDSLALDPALQGEVYYWKAWATRPMLGTNFHLEFLDEDQLTRLEPGDAGVVLDRSGRLRGFLRVPPSEGDASGATGAEAVFLAMDLNAGDYAAAITDEPGELLWDRVSGDGPKSVQAKTGDGHLVRITSRDDYVDTAESFLRETRFEPPPLAVSMTFLVLPIGLAGFLAWRNLRMGRGDRRGANLFAGVVFVGYMLQSLLALDLDRMPPSTLVSRMMADMPFGHALYHSFVVWIQYIAIEPYLRRVRPAALVSWARMVSRRWRDPILGRDILAGLFLASVMLATQYAVGRLLMSVEGQLFDREILTGGRETAIASAPNALAAWAYAIAFAAPAIMLAMVCYLILVLILRRDALAIGAIPVLMLIPATFFGGDSPGWFNAIMGLAVVGALVTAVMRFGVLAGVTVMLVLLLADSIPWALAPAAWYGPIGMMTPVALSALAIWAGITALGDQASVRGLLGEDRNS